MKLSTPLCSAVFGLLTSAVLTAGCATESNSDLAPVVARSVDDGSMLLGGVYDASEEIMYFNADLAAEVASLEAAGSDLTIHVGTAVFDISADGIASAPLTIGDVAVVTAERADGSSEVIASFEIEAPERLDSLTEAEAATRFGSCHKFI